MRALEAGVIALFAAPVAVGAPLDDANAVLTRPAVSLELPPLGGPAQARGAQVVAVPEPGAIALLGVAAGVATRRRREE